MITARYDVATNAWMPDGPAPDGVTVKEVTVIRNPDERTEKYSGDPVNPIAARTSQEIAAYDAALADKQALQQFARVVQAAMAAMYKDVHGSFPNPSQKAALRADFVTAWKALG